jgi:hypothetical protein
VTGAVGGHGQGLKEVRECRTTPVGCAGKRGVGVCRDVLTGPHRPPLQAWSDLHGRGLGVVVPMVMCMHPTLCVVV